MDQVEELLKRAKFNLDTLLMLGEHDLNNTQFNAIRESAMLLEDARKLLAIKREG